MFVQKSNWVYVSSQFEPLNHVNLLGYFKEYLQKGRSLGFYLFCLGNKKVDFFPLGFIFTLEKSFSLKEPTN